MIDKIRAILVSQSALVTIIVVASLVRLINLGSIPVGMQWDELGYAYNAYSIIETGRDEWSQRLPLFLKSFGDYKPALLSYVMIPSMLLFGFNEFAVKLPTALFGILSIVGFYGLVLTLSKNKKLSFVVSILLSITPWHIHYSKIAFDPIVSLAFLLTGLALFVQKEKRVSLLGSLSLFLSMYTYNAARFFVPLIVIAYIFIFKRTGLKQYLKNNKFTLSSLLIAICLIFSLTFFTEAGARAKSVFFWDPVEATSQVEEGIYRNVVLGNNFIRVFNNKAIYISYQFVANYMKHFSYEYLFADTYQTPAFAFPRHGHLLLVFLPLLIIGVFISEKSKIRDFFLFWLLFSPIASALTAGQPNANRSLIMIPAIVYFVGLGSLVFLKFFKSRLLSLSVTSLLFFMVLFNFALYRHDYQIYFPELSVRYWHGYYRQVAQDIYAVRDKYNQIYFTNTDTQPYIFFAWYNLIDPKIVQENSEDRDIKYLGGIKKLENINFISLKKDDFSCLILEENVLLVTSTNDEFDFSYEKLAPTKTYSYQDRFHPEKDALKVYDSNSLSEEQVKLFEELCK